MMTLPLFPLNTVLFPGIPVYLHIFEARYKQMIEQCIAEERSFGVVLIREGVEVGGSGRTVCCRLYGSNYSLAATRRRPPKYCRFGTTSFSRGTSEL